jgi:hypothetical protein
MDGVLICPWSILGPFCHTEKLVRFEVRFVVHQIVPQIVQKPPRKTQFSGFFLHDLRYDFEVQFQGRLECTPSRRRQKL